PKSLQEKIDAFKTLGGELSQRTTMSITDIVEDPTKEFKNIQAERQEEANNNPALSDFDLEVLRRETDEQ
ncbi:TPA: phage portal protein, partial [Streptococcus pyogenes]